MLEFVHELNDLQSGVVLEEKTLPVRLGAVVCDAPAKSFILAITCHSGFYGCTKCIRKGGIIKRRLCFPELDTGFRTNKSFKGNLQEEYHFGTTFLERLPIDLVKLIPLHSSRAQTFITCRL